MPRYSLGEFHPEFPTSGNYWIAPSADIIGRVVLKENASVWYGAVLRGDNDPIIIGENSNIQDGTIIHTDIGYPAIVGRDVTVGHKVILHACTIGDETLIGMGAIILNRARIGRNCIIGAHALIAEGKEIPDNSLVMGAPGKVIRQLSDAQVQLIRGSAHHYVENWKRHRDTLVRLDR
jgi:carbonic anhydrase/acetyltransferase-like protein (isoleucine patch superfamily)